MGWAMLKPVQKPPQPRRASGAGGPVTLWCWAPGLGAECAFLPCAQPGCFLSSTPTRYSREVCVEGLSIKINPQIIWALCVDSSLQLMCELGNGVINRVYEAQVEKMGVQKPHASSHRYCLHLPPPSCMRLLGPREAELGNKLPAGWCSI